jgi:GT2 family glycosyltransferase
MNSQKSSQVSLSPDTFSVLVHVVTWNDQETIARCIQEVIEQEGFTLGDTLAVRITDNASSDSTLQHVRSFVGPGVEVHSNPDNLGFCGAHNQGVGAFLDGAFDALLILNPDVRLSRNALMAMCAGFGSSEHVGMVTPKLLRANAALDPVDPPVLDAAGMILTSSLRHFDRGSGERDQGLFDRAEEVFGGTGACLLLSRRCVEDLLISTTVSDEVVARIYPQLKAGASERPKLFDEAFFAYREDADLSWRAQLLGWRCRYEPRAIGYHVRVVVPERRRELPPALNSYSVRNRFLMQVHNWRFSWGIASLCGGIFLRNMAVVLGVVLRERSSLGALVEVLRLLPRALKIRRDISQKMRARARM